MIVDDGGLRGGGNGGGLLRGGRQRLIGALAATTASMVAGRGWRGSGAWNSARVCGTQFGRRAHAGAGRMHDLRQPTRGTATLAPCRAHRSFRIHLPTPMPTLRRRILALACLSALQPAFAQAPDASAANPPPTATCPAAASGCRATSPSTANSTTRHGGGALVQEIATTSSPATTRPRQSDHRPHRLHRRRAVRRLPRARPGPGVDPHLRNLGDRDAFNDDWVGLFLDTFSDHRRGYELVSNPLGVQGDLIRRRNQQQQPRKTRAGTGCGAAPGASPPLTWRCAFLLRLRFPARRRNSAGASRCSAAGRATKRHQ